MAELVHAVPLADLPVVEESTVKIEVLPARGMIALRGPMEDGRFIEAVRGAVGFEPPDRRRFRFEDGRGAFWMSPDELLLMTPREEVAGCIETLGAALEGVHHLVADMSDARAVFRLTGTGTREVLAKGVPVDLDRAAFRPGMLRRTRIGSVAAALYQTSETPEIFELLCFRSYARHVHGCLCRFAREGTLPAVFGAP